MIVVTAVVKIAIFLLILRGIEHLFYHLIYLYGISSFRNKLELIFRMKRSLEIINSLRKSWLKTLLILKVNSILKVKITTPTPSSRTISSMKRKVIFNLDIASLKIAFLNIKKRIGAQILIQSLLSINKTLLIIQFKHLKMLKTEDNLSNSRI